MIKDFMRERLEGRRPGAASAVAGNSAAPASRAVKARRLMVWLFGMQGDRTQKKRPAMSPRAARFYATVLIRRTCT
ncbi:MAG: hypothetical protein ABWY02_16040 [Telluria sp.]